MLTPDGHAIEEFITVGVTPEERAAIGDPPAGHGMLGVLIQEPHPLRLPDIAEDPRSVGFPPNHPPMRSFLGAAGVGRGRVFGNIYLTEKLEEEEFDEEDEPALDRPRDPGRGRDRERAPLRGDAASSPRAAPSRVLDDRERIAKELHDGVIQSLFAVGMGLQGTAALAKDEEIAARVEGAVEEIDHAIRDLRNYIFGLRPGFLADRQLDQALRELGDEFANGPAW